MNQRLTVALAVQPSRIAEVTTPDHLAALAERFELRRTADELTPETVGDFVADAEVVVTSWGTPVLDLAGLPRLRAVGHAAGTVKNLFADPARVLSGEVAVFSGAGRIALSVAEYCLTVILVELRRLTDYAAAFRAGGWSGDVTPAGRELSGRRVAILGASRTGRALAALLRPFRCDVVFVDPYLTAAEAAALGGRRAELAEALATADVVSLHLPNLPATRGLVTAELLATVPDGAVVVNSSRADVVDHAALLAEGARGRLRVAVDVHPTEPVPAADRAAIAGSVLATPHLAGNSLEGRQALVGFVTEAIEAYLTDGTDGPDRVQPAAWETLA